MAAVEVSIRAATPEDVPGILPMVQKVCDFHQALDPARFDFEPGIGERYRRWLIERAGDPKSVLLVAESLRGSRTPALVGFIVGSVVPNIPIYQTKEFAQLHDLWVEPQARGQGVGRALVIEAVRRFERIGVRQIRGETAAGNEAARKMLDGLGFRWSVTEVLRTRSDL